MEGWLEALAAVGLILLGGVVNSLFKEKPVPANARRKQGGDNILSKLFGALAVIAALGGLWLIVSYMADFRSDAKAIGGIGLFVAAATFVLASIGMARQDT